jgi:hypothetical protein
MVECIAVAAPGVLPFAAFYVVRHSSGYSAIRARRHQRATSNAPQFSRELRQKQFSRKIHRQSARQAQDGDIPLGFMSKKLAKIFH